MLIQNHHHHTSILQRHGENDGTQQFKSHQIEFTVLGQVSATWSRRLHSGTTEVSRTSLFLSGSSRSIRFYWKKVYTLKLW